MSYAPAFVGSPLRQGLASLLWSYAKAWLGFFVATPWPARRHRALGRLLAMAIIFNASAVLGQYEQLSCGCRQGAPAEGEFYPKPFWSADSVLTIAFLDGEDYWRRSVTFWAKQWAKGTDYKLQFLLDSNASPRFIRKSKIRITFKGKGNWSYLGTHSSQLEDKMAPTMCLAGLANIFSNSRYSVDSIFPKLASHVVLHQFGHALGFVQEWRPVKANWDTGAIYRVYREHCGWDTSAVKAFLLKSSRLSTNFAVLSLKSVMRPAIIPALFKGKAKTTYNHTLSPLDKNLMSFWYSHGLPVQTLGLLQPSRYIEYKFSKPQFQRARDGISLTFMDLRLRPGNKIGKDSLTLKWRRMRFFIGEVYAGGIHGTYSRWVNLPAKGGGIKAPPGLKLLANNTFKCGPFPHTQAALLEVEYAVKGSNPNTGIDRYWEQSGSDYTIPQAGEFKGKPVKGGRLYLTRVLIKEFENDGSEGVIEYNNGIYKGGVRYGFKHGRGQYKFTSGAMWQGVWVADELVDDGGVIKIYNDGSRESLTLKAGKWVPAWVDMPLGKYRGPVDTLHKASGPGEMIFHTGGQYSGGFLDGKLHGKGSITFENGNTFNGGFKLGKFSGKGVLVNNELGLKWQGVWHNDTLTQGKMIELPSGSLFKNSAANMAKNGLKLKTKSYEGAFTMLPNGIPVKDGEGIETLEMSKEKDQVIHKYKGIFKQEALWTGSVTTLKNGKRVGYIRFEEGEEASPF